MPTPAGYFPPILPAVWPTAAAPTPNTADAILRVKASAFDFLLAMAAFDNEDLRSAGYHNAETVLASVLALTKAKILCIKAGAQTSAQTSTQPRGEL